MIGFKSLARKTTNLLLALALVSAQLFAPLSALVPVANAVHPSPVYECVNDTAGPNDEPGQKDLNTLCVDDTHLPQEVDVTWNWDEAGTTGENSMDACSLFDTDSDGRANYSVCVVTNGTPAIETATVLYSCGDDKPDRCTSPVTPLTITGNTSCDVVSPSPDDPFAGTGNAKGDDFPNDTKAICTLDLSDVGGVSAAELIDVCSYPSQQPNSDPSDCVIIKDTTAFISLVKQIVPETDNGLFNLLINGQVKASDVSDNGTTGIVNVEASGSGQGTVFTVSETAGTNTSLSGYTSNVQCTKEDKNGTPTVGPNVSGTSTTVALKPAEEAICVFTNTRAGSITIVKDAIPNDAQDFTFTATGTGVSNFSLDDDANGTLFNTQTFSNLSAGTYTFTEASVAGWYLDNIECPNIAETKDLVTGQVSLTISAGQNITCTFTNRKLGQLLVTKQTNPNGDQQTFSITATGTNTISGNATRDIVDDETETYTVRHGEYDVNEQDIAGWAEDDSACQNLVIDGNTPLVNGIPTRSCTITNTKLATLIIIKNALPDHEQDFAFTTTGTGLSNFSLDDDSDNTLSNQVTFSNLTPNQQYSVTEQSTPGWSLTGLTCNDVAQQGSTATVTPTPGQTITCTFTNTKLISVSGTKFEVDAGATDGGLGTVLGGWTIYIDSNNNGELDPGELSDVTDENGNYSFSDLLYGTTITLREVLQAGWTQIFGPDTFVLDSANDVTNKDFGNFENATISGFKWNDKNANDVVNEGEEKLNGWTITLYNDGDDQDTELDDVVASTVTAGEGAYSFTNLTPGTYAICETQQAGWIQTFPNGNGCHTIVIDESGETEQANFGNQGRGTITVIKNVDTDGDGQINDQGVTTWTWDIDGSGNFATGSGNSQPVAAGNYTVSEDQQANYHVTASSCTGETPPQAPTTSLSVSVSSGENVVCTFTNTRDTATITINKVVNPTNDSGKFNLNIDGVAYATDVSHGGTTGAVKVPTGTYTVSETAGTGTSLSDYQSSHECVWNNLRGGGDSTTSVSGLVVEKDDSLVCTFTNIRYGKIIVEKQTLPEDSPQSFDFTASYDNDGFGLTDGQQNDSGNLLPDTYSVSETDLDGWDLTSAICSDQSPIDAISLQAGETVTCVFTNTQRGSISGTKYEVDAEATEGFEGDELDDWTIFIDEDDNGELDTGEVSTVTDTSGDYIFNDLVPGTYVICEVLQTGWTQVFPEGKPGCYEVVLDAGQNSTGNDFGNFKNGSITGYKFNDHNGNGTEDDGDEKLEGWEITLFQGQDIVDVTYTDENGNYSFTDLTPGSYVVCETDDRSGWVQTSPDPAVNEGCYDVVIGESDEEETAIFGNQGRGSVQVIKNVDNNGDGDTDDEGETGASNWFWDLDGTLQTSSDIATGQSLDVPAGDYSVSEDMQTDYHFVSVTCTVNRQVIEVTQDESVNITMNPGDAVVCTFENARNTATITVEKQLIPESDNGLFDLFVGEEKVKDDASDGDTGSTTVLTNTNYTVSETGNEGTDLGDYISQYRCTNEQNGTGTSVQVSLANHGDQLTCTFTNTRRPTITIIKDAVSTNSDDLEQDFGFTTSENLSNFTLDDNGDNTDENSNTKIFNQLTPEEQYTVTESELEGWDLTDINCGESESVSIDEVGRKVTITPLAGENVSCTFENTKRGEITVIKDAVPNDAQDFHFTISEADDIILLSLDESTGNNGGLGLLEENPNEFDLDDDDDATLSDRNTVSLSPGVYTITEDTLDGWDLNDIDCGETFAFRNGNNVDVFVNAGDEITCTFENHKRATVTVTKYNDYNRDGDKDDNEPTLLGWEFTLEGETEGYQCEGIGCIVCFIFPGLCESSYQYDQPPQTTGDDGMATFTNVKANVEHSLTETQQDGWFLSEAENGMVCRVGEEKIGERDGESYSFSPEPGAQVDCEVGNYRAAYMLIEKTNDRPEPVNTGEVVTYTITVTVPEDSNPVYGATVTDLPPEGFEYIPGSETATQGSLTTPYASPGVWSLGDLFPGDVVTLTYQARIANSASPGTYPDLAFASGCDTFVEEGDCEVNVYANVTVVDENGTPFVGTEVTIRSPQVLAANTTVLVNTGSADIWKNMMIGTLLMGAALATLYRRDKKGGRA